VSCSTCARTLTPPHTQEAASFFKARSLIERDYGRDLLKLAKTSVDTYSLNDGKAGCAPRPRPARARPAHARAAARTSTRGTA
jgi:hypothetical protein